MSRLQFITIQLLFMLTLCKIHSQVTKPTRGVINNVNFELSDDKVIITYDLIRANETDFFDIKVNIYRSSSNEKVEAKTFSGDLFNQTIGKGKTITWYISKDMTYLDDNIYIELEGEHVNPKEIPYTSKKRALLYSTIFPGFGTSKITVNNVHLVKGIAAYSMVGLSIWSNIKAVDYYEQYKASNISQERELYYDKAVNSYTNSIYFMSGAVVIWISEYIWIMATKNKTLGTNKTTNLQLGYNYCPQIKTPVISLSYYF